MKKITLLFLMMFTVTCWQVNAQDTCGTAVPVTPGSFTGTTITAGTGSAEMAPSGADSAFFVYTATADGDITVSSCGGGADTDLSISDGDTACGALVGTNNDDACDLGTGDAWASELTVPVENGKTYYIEWSNEWSVGPFDWSLTYTPPAPAPNCATDPMPTDGAVDVPVGSVTFSWTAPASGPAPTSYDLYAGETTGLEYGLIGNFTTTSAALTISANSLLIYWQVVPKNGSTAATGCPIWSFTTADPPPAPANDTPIGAIDLILDEGTACGANSITGITNEGSTDSGEGTPTCGSYSPSATNGDLWYKFVAPATGSLTLNTENLVDLTSVAGNYYSGTPGALVDEGCTQFSTGWPWNLSGLTPGDTYYLRVWDFGNDQFGSFDLCGYFVSCPSPTALSVSVVDTTTASIGWTDGGTETAWEYVVQAPGTGEPAGAGTATSTNPSSVSGLTEDNNYEFYVRANCGGSFSEWSGPFNWTQTLPPANDECAGAIPLTVNTDFNCATVTSATNFAATASSQPDDATGTPDDDVWFTFVATSVSHRIVLDNVVAVTGTSTDMGMSVFDDAAGCNMTAANEVGESDPNTLNLSSLTIGNTYYVRVYGWFGGASSAKTTFDVCVGTEPACLAPGALNATSITQTSADLGWTENGTATAWNVELGLAGFTATGTPTNTGVSNPFSASGLTAETDYEFYVQADCGVDGTSAWEGPFAFTTALAPIVPDYTADFAGFPPTGWTEADGPYGTPSGTTSIWQGDDFGNDVAAGRCAKINIFSNQDDYLISPSFNLSGATFYLNADIAFTTWNGTAATTFGSDDYVALLVTQDGGTTWTELTRFDTSTGAISPTGEAISQIDLVGYGADVQFAFYGSGGTLDDAEDNDFFVDNFMITSAPLSVDSNTLEGFSLYPNPVKNELFLNAQDNIQEVEVYNLLGRRVMVAKPNLLRTSVSLESLSTGMYIVKVKVNDKVGSYKIIKE